MSVVRLVERKGNVVRVKGIDVLDGTAFIDAKPYVPTFDSGADAKMGWLEGKTRTDQGPSAAAKRQALDLIWQPYRRAGSQCSPRLLVRPADPDGPPRYSTCQPTELAAIPFYDAVRKLS
jgi:hypothetical protein